MRTTKSPYRPSWAGSVALAGALVLTAAAQDTLHAQVAVTPRAASIRVGGRVQAQYASSSVEAVNDGFFFRRARITADATVNDFLDARISPEFAGGGATLKDVYVRFRFSPGLHVTMGQFKRPFDLFELSSSTDLSLIERDGRVGGVDACSGVGGVCSYSRLTEKLAWADRDVGIRVNGSRGKVSYAVSVTNGAGANKADENDSRSYSGRLSVEVAEGVVVSGQAALHDYPVSDTEDEYAGAWGADVQVGGWRDGFLLQAAYVGGDNWKNLDSGGSPSAFAAFQAVASYYAPVSGERFTALEPVLRVSYADPDGDQADDGGVVFTPGLMVYVVGKNKIGLNVDVWSPQAGTTQYSLKIQSFLYF